MSKKLLMEALGKLDDKVASEAVVEQISEAFDKAVIEKADEKVKELQESVIVATDEYTNKILESHVVDLKENFEKAVVVKATKLSESYADDLKAQLEESYKNELTEINEGVEKYLEYAVDKFVNENMATWKDELAVAKANAIMESATDFAENFGIKLASITDEDEAKKQLDESVNTINEMKSEIANLKREAIIAESTKDMTIVEKDKLMKLVEGVEYTEGFKDKLELFKSTLIDDKKEIVTESTKKTDKKYSWE